MIDTKRLYSTLKFVSCDLLIIATKIRAKMKGDRDADPNYGCIGTNKSQTNTSGFFKKILFLAHCFQCHDNHVIKGGLPFLGRGFFSGEDMVADS